MNDLAKRLLSEVHPERLDEAIIHDPLDLPSVGDTISVVELSSDKEVATIFFESGKTVCVHLINDQPQASLEGEPVNSTD